MFFGGILKLTLLDYPDKTACTLFTAGCNFGCPFCQNASLAVWDEKSPQDAQSIDASEVLEFLKSRQSLLDGVCISGGEPLLHDELDGFIGEVKAMGFLVKLDTNGSHPKKLEKLIRSGAIDYVAMDIKNTPEKYAQTIGLPEYDVAPVEESMTLLRSGTLPYEFRTTVVRELHTVDDLLIIARWISGAKKYFLQSFVDSGGVLKKGLHSYTEEEMRQFHSKIEKILPSVELRGI